MRRADAIWLYNPSVSPTAFTDVTRSLGNGSASTVLTAGSKLYIGCSEWLAGVLLFINTQPTAKPDIVPEVYDGELDSWRELTLGDRFDILEDNASITYPMYSVMNTGVLSWVATTALWESRVPDGDNGFPEYAVPPTVTPQLFWIRLRNAGSVDVKIDRLLPNFYNTYATAEEITRYLGVRDFSSITHPLLTAVKERIRMQEDILDDYMRKTYRIGMVINERNFFNPYGIKPRYWPVIAVTRLGIWTGSNFQIMLQGRNQDYFVDNGPGGSNSIYFTRISLGRGIPWSRASSRFLRENASLEFDYVYGGDFELAPRRGLIKEIVTQRVCAGLIMEEDWVKLLISNPNVVSKAEKVEIWTTQADEKAEQIRGLALN